MPAQIEWTLRVRAMAFRPESSSSRGKRYGTSSDVDKVGNVIEKSWCSAGEVEVIVLSLNPEESISSFAPTSR